MLYYVLISIELRGATSRSAFQFRLLMMNSLMRFQVRLLTRNFATKVAFEWSFTSMSSLMFFQTVQIGKSNSAIFLPEILHSKGFSPV